MVTFCKYGNEYLDLKKAGEICHQLSYYQYLNNDAAPCS
jgi:hypothetical protein